MIRFTILASGSKGNAAVIESDGYRILIDCGLSLRELTKRLAVVGLQPTDLDALLITHFHSDHVKGISTVLQKIPLEVFARAGLHGLPMGKKAFQLTAYQELEIGSFKITPLSLPHDNGGSFGFDILSGSDRLVYATDLGNPTEELAIALHSADLAIIESNHDLEMLDACSYPDYIKNRIRSNYGHLSNCQCAELLQKYLSPKCRRVVLAHLSEKANHPAQALATMRHAISNHVSAASQSTPTIWFGTEKIPAQNELSRPG